jgi:DNA polymerase-3 subunit alpha
MKKETFVSLHNHSSLSFSDALISVNQLVNIAKTYDSPAVAITEHGHMASMPIFFKECEKAGIKPIVGVEFYFMWHDKRDTERTSYHLLANVKNETGYRNLLKLMYLSNVPVADGGGFYFRPRITEKMLYAHQEGLIVSSSCIQGPVANLLLDGRDMEAFMVAEELRDNLDEFRIEIMPHKLELQVRVNKRLIEIGKRLDIPVITSLDTHIADTSYNEAYTCNGDLRRNKTASDVTTDNDEIKCVTDWDLHYKSLKEIYDVYSRQDIPDSVVRETLANTLHAADGIDFTWEKRYFDAPKFAENADQLLTKMLSERLVKMFGGRNNIPQEYKDRTRHEFDIISRMGFSNYFLILHDAIDFCHTFQGENGKQGIIVGPGRGSAGGALLAYILGITKIDPVKYGLPFERFLNPERTNTAPDIDVDVEPRGREILINYLKQRWGDTSVVQVATHSELKIKAALKDVGKWLRVPFNEMNEITASIPAKGWDDDGNPVEMKYVDAIKLPEVQKWKQKHPRLFDIAEKLEGSYRQIGIHAGAVCITSEPAEQQIPLMKKKNDTGADVMVAQWDKGMLESVGIHKYDFLGLSTLEILAELEALTGVKLDNIPLDDKLTWNYFQEAKHMLGIFQFIEDKTKGLLRDIKPANLNELGDINTLIRPGADVDGYKKNKKAKKVEYKFDLPEVRKVLANSYGAVIYQEHIMELAKELGGFTLGQGDMLRRALEKNDGDKIAAYKKQFTDNCKYPELASELFDWIGANASYLFNKSHALVYSLVGYWCAYYKANYPEQFLVANLNHPKSNQKESESEYIAKFVFEAREMGIEVSLPRLGFASPKATCKRGVVYYGLTGIKGISDTSAQVLCDAEGDDFVSYVDAALSVKREHHINGKVQKRSVINKGHILNLVKIGFFGDTNKALENFNTYFKAKEDTEQEFDAAVNEAVGFEWYSPLMKFYDKLDPVYKNTDLYMLIEIKSLKRGEGNYGKWTMVKGKTPSGDITGFIKGHEQISKSEVILASYSKSKKGDAININNFKLMA